MSRFFSNIFNWICRKPDIPEINPNIIFERNISSDNDFWISCILDPTLDIKYINGFVTKILDTDMCLINNQYHYKPKTEKEIRDFPSLELNCPVRVSLYRKKNSNEWIVASCFSSNKEGDHHQPAKIIPNPVVGVELNDNTTINGQWLNTNEVNKNITNEKNDIQDVMTVQVLGEMPKVVDLEQELIIQILFRNNSYVKEQKLFDYQTMQGKRVQLSIINKQNTPVTIGVQSQCIFDITLKGRYLGRSIEKVEFNFIDIIYKVGVNIDVTDSRIIIPQNPNAYVKHEVDMKRILELQNEHLIPGVLIGKKVQFPYRQIGQWNIPPQLTKCYWTDNGKFNTNVSTEVKEQIEKLYPAAFQTLTYQNYKAKFHTLLFMEEIEGTMALQKYAKDRIHFETNGEFLSLKMSDLSEQRPSLIPGDRAVVTDVPNCTKRLGDKERYEGIIHKVLANEIWLKFDAEFHNKCGHWDYSVNFFSSRIIHRKQHDVLNEVWKNSHLGESFLFPYKSELEYKPPRLYIMEDNEMNENTSNADNLKENNTLSSKLNIIKELKWFNENLNFEQKTAVINILKGEARPMPYLIYGPPGTGKTITLTESIIQVYKEFSKSKLLICAPTNSAVDILMGKLIGSELFNITILKRLIGYTHLYSSSYNMDYDKYCFLPELESSCHVPQDPDSKLIRKNDILKLRIVVTTEGTAGLLYTMGLKKGIFSHIFIDEAGQSTEPESLLPLSFLDPCQGQVVLAGDPKQLGPVIMSRLVKTAGLGQSMLARLINFPSYMRDPVCFQEYNGFNPKVITHLVQNYRSLPEIVNNFSKLFYNSFLVATKLEPDSSERKLLSDLSENHHWNIGCDGPIIVHGIMGENNQDPYSPSWFNPHEAFQVLLYVTRLIKVGISTNEIGIITPYSAQVNKINELLRMYHSDINLPRVGTVEMFQGQEKTIVIISMVRSKCSLGNEKDTKFNIGFLNTKTRTNVALSRAKALLIIIANPLTMNMSTEWKYVLSNAVKSKNYVGCNIPNKKLQSELIIN
ncbi:P-loop containing nucleoside triphosphate hydrolase [Cinara cedri]|uniref:RNA helicase n=1 Tax=Cinara cedri TaxID=506608 RepID=A0A5E4NQW7_9HEMI|nr:P-loop containing nucleoside triphosphate hydrolase [Cinara cedri]